MNIDLNPLEVGFLESLLERHYDEFRNDYSYIKLVEKLKSLRSSIFSENKNESSTI
jgi:hypothetical protein